MAKTNLVDALKNEQATIRWLGLFNETQLRRFIYLAAATIIRNFPNGPYNEQAESIGDALINALLKD